MGRVAVLGAFAALLVMAGTAGADTGDPKKAITSADRARAESLLLTRADLGQRWTQGASSPSDDNNLRCPGYSPDLSDLTVTGEAESPDFTLETASEYGFASSFSEVYRTAAQLRTAWGRVVKPELRRCFVRLLESEVGKNRAQDVKVAVSAAKTLTLPRAAPRQAAFRVVADVTTEGVTFPMYLDIVFLADRRAVVGFMVLSALKPFPRAQEVGLAQRTAGRITKAFT
jgi:hypothetical protein